MPVNAKVPTCPSSTQAPNDVPQLYLTQAPNEKRMRLLGFERVELAPGESRQVTLTADPRLLARFDAGADQWRILMAPTGWRSASLPTTLC